MRIRRIALSNLNSLRGNHVVDLTAEPLAGAGLFLISGATGAGKSTILDALTLALYGRAARYGNEVNPENMMSRHTASCRAEVEFEVSAGCFRAVWELRRARTAVEGRVQPPHRQLYDAAGVPLAQGTRDAEQRVEALIGLDYERFMRSALLAQGDFALFLRSKPNERAELLERLTGAEVYSRLGKLAYRERTRREREIEDEQRIINDYAVLDPSARTALEQEMLDIEARLSALSTVHAARTEMIAEIQRLADALDREREASRTAAELSGQRSINRSDFELLSAHRAAEPYAVLLHNLERAEDAGAETQARYAAAEDDARATGDAARQAYATLQRALTVAIAGAVAEVERATAAQRNAVLEREAAAQLVVGHRSDETLSAHFPDIVVRLSALQRAGEAARKLWVEWRPEQLRVPDEQIVQQWIADDHKRAFSAMAEATRRRDSAAHRVELARDHLERARRLSSFEEQRHLLEDGVPCPLCGATEHPYAEGAAPSIALQDLERELVAARQEAQDTEAALRAAGETLHRLEQRGVALTSAVRELHEIYRSARNAVEPFGLALEFGQETAARAEVERRVSSFNDYRARLEVAERAIVAAEQRALHAQGTLESLRERHPDPTPPGIRSGLEQPGDAEPSEAEPADLTVGAAETTYRSARERAVTALALLAERRSAAELAAGRLAVAAEECRAALAASPFGSLEQLRAARLAPAEAQRIGATAQRLERLETECSAQLRQAQTEIERLRAARVLEGQAAERYRAEHRAAEGERDSLIAQRARGGEQLKRDDQNHAQRRERAQRLELWQAELPVWRTLDALIGSADGKRFRAIAQSVTLDVLVRLANRHLRQLSDRYCIGRQLSGELELEIEDLHQAGTRRPMASLSGGESFLTSLALALGLSDLAGRTVRIDSLFIDEGFGSLDHDTLDLAISALENLQLHRKTVGVISHVALMKERIGTQIIVEPKTGGVSSLQVVQR